MQRLAELVYSPLQEYSKEQPHKYLSALERVLSVSSGIDAFDKLDVAKLVSESARAGESEHAGSSIYGDLSDDGEDTAMRDASPDDESNGHSGNGHAVIGKDTSILSQVSSVVVMSPIPWASASDAESEGEGEQPFDVTATSELATGQDEADLNDSAAETKKSSTTEEETTANSIDTNKTEEGQSVHVEDTGIGSSTQSTDASASYLQSTSTNPTSDDPNSNGSTTSSEDRESMDTRENSEPSTTTSNDLSDATSANQSNSTSYAQHHELTGSEGEKRRRLSIEPSTPNANSKSPEEKVSEEVTKPDMEKEENENEKEKEETAKDVKKEDEKEQEKEKEEDSDKNEKFDKDTQEDSKI